MTHHVASTRCFMPHVGARLGCMVIHTQPLKVIEVISAALVQGDDVVELFPLPDLIYVPAMSA